MAKKTQDPTTSPAPELDDFDAFEGEYFSRELGGMWKKSPGAIIRGKLSHSFEYDNENGHAVGLALVLDAPADVKRDGRVTVAPIGEVVGVTLNKKLLGLLEYRQGSEIRIRCEGEVELSGGRSTWNYSVKVKGQRRPGGSAMKPTKVTDPESPPEDDDSDLGF